MSEQTPPAAAGPVELVLGPLVEQSLVQRLRHAAAKKWPDGHPAQPFSLFSEAADALERKSDALQRLWAERDELRAERERLRAAAQKAEDALTWAHGGEPLPTLEREALDLLRPLLRA